MSNWCNPITRILFVLILAGSALVSLAGPQEHPCVEHFSEAMGLVRTFYPDLHGKGVTLDITSSVPFEAQNLATAFYVNVSERHFDEPIRGSGVPNPSSADRVGHLSTYFQYDGRDNQILYVFASGSFVNSEKLQSLTKLIDEHPNWSEAQMAEALVAAGGKFDPKNRDSVLARFPKNGLESILGKIEIRSAEFEFRRNAEAPSGARMEWSVRFRASKNLREEYFVSMEPFEGKIVMFGRTPFPVENR